MSCGSCKTTPKVLTEATYLIVASQFGGGILHDDKETLSKKISSLRSNYNLAHDANIKVFKCKEGKIAELEMSYSFDWKE